MKNEIKDVINGRKWQNSSFIKLNNNMIVVDPTYLDHDKLESRGTGPSTGAGSALYYKGYPMTVG